MVPTSSFGGGKWQAAMRHTLGADGLQQAAMRHTLGADGLQQAAKQHTVVKTNKYLFIYWYLQE